MIDAMIRVYIRNAPKKQLAVPMQFFELAHQVGQINRCMKVLKDYI